MTKPTRIFTLLAALSAIGTPLLAQSATPKVATVDLNRAYAEYWKTQEKMGKLIERGNDAQEQINDMQKRIESIASEGKQLQQDSDNPALTPEAKARISSDAKKKYDEFQEMQERLRQFAENMERSIQQERKVFTELMLEEIKEKVLAIAKERGANFVVDISGRTSNGVSSILYSDPGFDVTDAVIKALNESKPADFKPPTLPNQPSPSASSTPAPSP